MERILMILSICLSMEFAFPVYGKEANSFVNQETVENVTPEGKDPAELSAAEIVDSLYAHVPDRTIAEAAKDEAMILTNESIATKFYGYIKIGQYRGDRVYEHCEIWALLGETNFSAIKTEDGYIMLMPYSELPDRDKAVRNKQYLDRLYNQIWDIREATDGMGQKEKSDYIIHYLKTHLKAYDHDAPTISPHGSRPD